MEWSFDVAQADWIRDRLAPFDSGVVTSVVPGGFASYARILHPAGRSTGDAAQEVRWGEVAAWSGEPLSSTAQFPDIALPERDPGPPPPYDAPPMEGTLPASYAAALVEVLQRHTEPSQTWWFAVWNGFGWEPGPAFVLPRSGSAHAQDDGWTRMPERYDDSQLVPVPPSVNDADRDPVPPEVRAGPVAELPGREYFLWSGEPHDALALVPAQDQTPQLWWPADRSWCVATEIDLTYTLVGGSGGLVSQVVTCPELEAQAVDPTTSHWSRAPAWIARRVAEATAELLATGSTSIDIWAGRVDARMTRSGSGIELETRRVGRIGGRSSGGSGWTSLSDRDADQLAKEVRSSLTWAVLDLVC